MIVPYPKPNPKPIADPGGICWGQYSGEKFFGHQVYDMK